MLASLAFTVSGSNEAELESNAEKLLHTLVTDPDKWRVAIEAHWHEAHEDEVLVGKVTARRKRRQNDDDDWGW